MHLASVHIEIYKMNIALANINNSIDDCEVMRMIRYFCCMKSHNQCPHNQKYHWAFEIEKQAPVLNVLLV